MKGVEVYTPGSCESQCSLELANCSEILAWAARNYYIRDVWCDVKGLLQYCTTVVDKLVDVCQVSVVGCPFAEPFSIGVPLVFGSNILPDVRVIFCCNEHSRCDSCSFSDKVMD